MQFDQMSCKHAHQLTKVYPISFLNTSSFSIMFHICVVFYCSSCGLLQLPLRVERHLLDRHRPSSLLRGHRPQPVHPVGHHLHRRGLPLTLVPLPDPPLELIPTQGVPLHICLVNILCPSQRISVLELVPKFDMQPIYTRNLVLKCCMFFIWKILDMIKRNVFCFFIKQVSKSCLKILLKMQIAKCTGTYFKSELVVYYTPRNLFFLHVIVQCTSNGQCVIPSQHA